MISDVPKVSDSAYMKVRKHELFRKRAGIEPVIGHCMRDHRLGQNFYKGLFGDSINVMLAAAAYNINRAMRLLLCLFRWGLMKLMTEGQWPVVTCNADTCAKFLRLDYIAENLYRTATGLNIHYYHYSLSMI